MILIYVEHGLGNQMFQYAFGRVIAEQVGIKNVQYDISRLPSSIVGRKTWDINDIFEYNFPIANDFIVWKITGFNPWVYKLLLDESKEEVPFRPKRKKCRYVCEPRRRWTINEAFIKKVNDVKWNRKRNYYVKGFWEDIRYFKGYDSLIKDMFRFKYKLSQEEKEKYNSIFKKNSVAIHIRRGDYLKQPKGVLFDLCDDSYYDKAMRYIEEKVDDPFYIFFSDDTEYIEDHYKHMNNKMIVSGNKDYVDLQLMTKCKHMICANSTFSFWGAYLNKNKKKVIVVPETHRIDRVDGWIKTDFPYEPGWERIENYID